MHFLRSATALLTVSGLALAAPLNKRINTAQDLQVLQFAHMLEEFEATFYLEGLSQFSAADFQAAGYAVPDLILEDLLTIGTQESAHIQFLVSTIEALGGTPISTCAFHFEPVLTDVATWIQFAREMEYIGMSAYQSAISMLDSPEIILDAAEILSVEARHQTLLNVFNGGSSSAQAFDVALTPNQLLAMVGQFLTGCDIFPKNLPMVPQVAHLFAAMPAGLALNWTWGNATTQTVAPTAFFCQWTSGTSPIAVVQPITECMSPNINGQVFAWITNSSVPLTTDIISQNAGNVVAGPAIAFVDTQMEILSELATTGGSGSTESSDVITPAQAGSIIQGCLTGTCSPTPANATTMA